MTTLKSLSKLQQRDARMRFRYDDGLRVVRDLRGNLAVRTPTTAKGLHAAGLRFLRAYADLFGNLGKSSMKILHEAADPNGGLSLVLQQYHGPYRVYGGSLRFHVTKDGVLDTINNRLFPDLTKVAKKPRSTADQAVRVAQRATKCTSEPAQPPELLVYRHDGKPRLAWEIRLNDMKLGERGAPALWVC